VWAKTKLEEEGEYLSTTSQVAGSDACSKNSRSDTSTSTDAYDFKSQLK
jgi:hypothetical protein